MKYRVMNTGDYREIRNQYHTGSLLAKVVSSFNYSPSELASFFNEKQYGTYRHESLEFIRNILLIIMPHRIRLRFCRKKSMS